MTTQERLTAAKQWIQEILKDLSRDENVQAWWWSEEEADNFEHLHITGNGKAESQAFPRELLFDCAHDHSRQSRAEVRHRLGDMLQRLAAKVGQSRQKPPDFSGNR